METRERNTYLSTLENLDVMESVIIQLICGYQRLSEDPHFSLGDRYSQVSIHDFDGDEVNSVLRTH